MDGLYNIRLCFVVHFTFYFLQNKVGDAISTCTGLLFLSFVFFANFWLSIQAGDCVGGGIKSSRETKSSWTND